METLIVTRHKSQTTAYEIYKQRVPCIFGSKLYVEGAPH